MTNSRRWGRIRNPSWTTLRPIGNSWAVRLTVIIPLVGYLIIFNAKLAPYIDLINEVRGALPSTFTLSISPRLFQIYFGLCFVAAGAAIYGLFCPSIIKKYSTAPAYIGDDGSHLGDYAFQTIEQLLKGTKQGAEYERIKRGYEQSARLTAAFSEQEKFQVNNALLFLYYINVNRSYPFWRATAAISYLVGFLILLVPSAKVFWSVGTILVGLVAQYGLMILWQ